MSEAIGYTAWDDNLYEWPPPEGWYEASDGRWWPAGYGPGQQEAAGADQTASAAADAAWVEADTVGGDGSPAPSDSGDETLVWEQPAQPAVDGDGDGAVSPSLTSPPADSPPADSLPTDAPSAVTAEAEIDDDERRRRMFEEPPPIDDLFGGLDPFAPLEGDDAWAGESNGSSTEVDGEAETGGGPAPRWPDPVAGPDGDQRGGPGPGHGGGSTGGNDGSAGLFERGSTSLFGDGPVPEPAGPGLFGIGPAGDDDGAPGHEGNGGYPDVTGERQIDRVPAGVAPLGLTGLQTGDTAPPSGTAPAPRLALSPDDDTVAFNLPSTGWPGDTEEAPDTGLADPAPPAGPGRLRPLVAIGLALVLVGAGVAAYLAFRPDSGEASTAEAAAGGPGSFEQPYGFGTGVVVFYPDETTGDERRWVIQVLNPVIDATDDLVEDLAVSAPQSGDVLALVRVRVTYQSGPEPGPLNQLRLNAVGPSGTTYTAATDGCTSAEPLDTGAELAALESAEGELCWAVAAEDLGSVLLAVQAGNADGTVHLQLQ